MLTAPTHGGVRWRFNASAHSLWMGWRHDSPNCILGAKRSFSRGARYKSRAMFYFWSWGGGVSQSNPAYANLPVQALANQTACMLREPDRSSFPHMPKNGGENNRSGRESPGAFSPCSPTGIQTGGARHGGRWQRQWVKLVGFRLFGEFISSVLHLNGQQA